MPKSIELAIGAALLSHLLLALLWLGWVTPGLAASLFLLSLAVWIMRGWFLHELKPADALFVPFGLLYAIHGLAPETSSDAIGYHLGLAAEWLRTGCLARPHGAGFFDVIPHGLETLFMAATALGGFTAAKLLHFGFLLATLPLMIRVAAQLGFEGRPAALLYFASPVVAMAGTSAYNDAAVAFYALAAFWLLLEGELAWAGLAAGFCYSIKMPGGVVTLAAAVFLLRRRSWSGLACMAAMAAPWLLHSWWLSGGNPVAPMLLSIFPSPALFPATVAGWTEYVRSYGVPWGERWWEITVGGARAQGLLGPGFLLSPVALLALRHRRHAWLMGAAGLCATGWFFNSGTRFLIPAALFVSLALAVVLPGRAAWGLALAQAVLCWPSVLDRYVSAAAWRLPSSAPWRAALRLEPEEAYLRRVSPGFLVAEMVNRHAESGERVLDFGEAPRAYVRGAELQASWQYAAAQRASAALVAAHTGARDVLYAQRGSWPRQRVRTMRFEQFSVSPDFWSIQEVRLWRAGERVFSSRAWELDAWPNRWDAPLAFDRNALSGWRTWEPRRDGMYLEIAGSIDSDGVELVCLRNEAGPRVRVTGVDERGVAVELAARLEPGPEMALNRREEAMRYVRREGFQWILTSTSGAGLEGLGRALVEETADWGLERVDRAGGVYLFRIR